MFSSRLYGCPRRQLLSRTQTISKIKPLFLSIRYRFVLIPVAKETKGNRYVNHGHHDLYYSCPDFGTGIGLTRQDTIEYAASVIDVIVQLGRDANGRRGITAIAESKSLL